MSDVPDLPDLPEGAVLPGDVLEFLATIGGTRMGAPSPWMVNPAALIAACVDELPRDRADVFLRVFDKQDWRLLLVCSNTHPQVDDMVSFAARPGVLLLVAKAAPAPPAVGVFWNQGSSDEPA